MKAYVIEYVYESVADWDEHCWRESKTIAVCNSIEKAKQLCEKKIHEMCPEFNLFEELDTGWYCGYGFDENDRLVNGEHYFVTFKEFDIET